MLPAAQRSIVTIGSWLLAQIVLYLQPNVLLVLLDCLDSDVVNLCHVRHLWDCGSSLISSLYLSILVNL